ncbi:MAG: magnesium/cobalt transporter CorA [Pseudomonadales bacterium]
MTRFKTYHPPGTAPGTLVPRTPAAAGGWSLSLTDFTDQELVEEQLESAEACTPYLSRESKTWIQVNGNPDEETLRTLGRQFDLQDLALEDVLNAGQRPKLDLYDDQLFLVLSLPRYRDGNLEVVQISIFAGENYLISFNPTETDPFEPIRKRIRPPNNHRLRTRSIDYLLYALIDLVIDAGFPVLELLGERIEQLEDDLLDKPGIETLAEIHRVRRELLLLRRRLWPQREVVSTLLRGDLPLIEEQTHPYLRDCYDHSIQIMDLLESFREMSTSLLDVYLSSISNRTNEIMRVLTIIATIFIPLTFIVGIYGMNFEHDTSPWAMPELGWYFGYPLIWLVMLSVVVGMLWFFRRRKWL